MAESKTIDGLSLLDYTLTPDQMKERSDKIQTDVTTVLDQVAAVNPKEATFENTIEPISDIFTEFENISGHLYIMANTSPDKAIRDMGHKVDGEMRQFNIDIYMRLDVYNALNAFVENNPTQYNGLEAQKKRLTDRFIRDYKRNGLHLDQETRDKLKELMKKKSDNCVKFSTALNEDDTKIVISRDELTGMTEDFINGLTKVEGEENKLYVSMKYPEMIPVMRSCSNPATRKAVVEARARQCMDVNVPLLEETIALRHEIAIMLGYTQFADYKLDTVMAKNAGNVEKFLTELTTRVLPKGRQELETLKEYKQKTDGLSEVPEFYAWDSFYYTEKLKQEKYTFDKEKVKEYFPTSNVIDQTLSIYQELLSLKFEQVTGEDAKVWFDEVTVYRVLDRDTEEQMGYFYLDLHPREGKYGHAAKFSIIPRGFHHGKMQIPVCAMVCNFTKAAGDKPSMLYFDEVETFFHEFGHVMHALCTRANYAEFSGTAVERDFVEAPSQMLENWCWDTAMLTRMSKHYQDGTPLPTDLTEKMIAAKNFGRGMLVLKQIFYGTVDMLLHTLHDSEFTEGLKEHELNWGELRKLIKRDGHKPDSAALWATLLEKIALQKPVEGANPIATFGHIAGGYEAGYYSYLWSEVFSCDMFGLFEKAGIMDPTLGRRYRDVILAPGGSRDSHDALTEFMGREVDQESFIRMNDL